jgi:hypothetical protein
MKSFGSTYISPFQGCGYSELLDIGLPYVNIYHPFRAFFNVKTILTVGIALSNKDFNIS